jgi:hypothetical protein
LIVQENDIGCSFTRIVSAAISIAVVCAAVDAVECPEEQDRYDESHVSNESIARIASMIVGVALICAR